MKNLSNSLARISQKKFLTILFLSIIILALPLVLIAMNSQTNTRQHAANQTCNPVGATRDQSGAYTFAPLGIDSKGNVVDRNNPTCIIHLLGFNQGNLESGSAGFAPPPAVDWYTQHIHTNIVRIAINGYWLMTNVPVPDQGNMGFQQYLDNLIHEEEQHGNYVIINEKTQFHQPPCSKNDPPASCPGPGAGGTDPTQKSSYQPTADWVMTYLAKKYGADPAVLIDVWNEPALREIQDENTFFSDMQERVASVSAVSPHTPMLVYIRMLNDIMNNPPGGPYSNFSSVLPIIWDVHIYDSGWSPADTNNAVHFAHTNGQAFTIGEWGNPSEEPPAFRLVPYVASNNLATSYWTAPYLSKGSPIPNTLNSNGIDVEASYSAVIGPPLPPLNVTLSPTPSTSPSPTGANGSPTPTPTPTPIQQGNTSLSVTVGLHGFGFAGDNVSPGSKGNMQPKHQTRPVTVTVLNLNGAFVATGTGQIIFDNTNDNTQGFFVGKVPLINMKTGDYLVRVKSNGFLENQIQSVIHIVKDQTISVPPVYLVNGDLDGNNALTILDYNIIANCFGAKQSSPSCPVQYRPSQALPGADILDDDGLVDGADYNEFIRELSVQYGSGGGGGGPTPSPFPSITPSPTP